MSLERSPRHRVWVGTTGSPVVDNRRCAGHVGADSSVAGILYAWQASRPDDPHLSGRCHLQMDLHPKYCWLFDYPIGSFVRERSGEASPLRTRSEESGWIFGKHHARALLHGH